MSEVVFEGDELSALPGEANLSVARSSVADFLVRSHVVKSERNAQFLAVSIALLSIGLVAGATIWATGAGATVEAKPYALMSAEERDALPAKHRIYLERLERAEAEQRARLAEERRSLRLLNSQQTEN
jgi:hypothetical protein